MRAYLLLGGSAAAAMIGAFGLVPLASASSAGQHTQAPAASSTIPIGGNTDTTGYAALTKPGAASAFRYVAATFTVPSANCSNDYAGSSESDFLVGLGGSYGHTSATIRLRSGYEAAGIYVSCEGSNNPVYEAGYCQLCSQPTAAFSVSPGDAIFASVFYSGSTKRYTYYVHDMDTGHKLRVTRSCASGCSLSSAQVTVNDQIATVYAAFSEVQLMAIKVTDTAGAGGGLVNSNWVTIGGYDGVSPDQLPPALGPLYSATSPGQSAFQVYHSKPS